MAERERVTPSGTHASKDLVNNRRGTREVVSEDRSKVRKSRSNVESWRLAEELRYRDMVNWARKRGMILRPRLSDEEKREMWECFQLLDADGSGALDEDELLVGFKALGLNLTRPRIRELMAMTDGDGSGEIELPEFEEMMLRRKQMDMASSSQVGSSSHPNEVPLDASLLARSYRRKRMLNAIKGNADDREALNLLNYHHGDASSGGQEGASGADPASPRGVMRAGQANANGMGDHDKGTSGVAKS